MLAPVNCNVHVYPCKVTQSLFRNARCALGRSIVRRSTTTVSRALPDDDGDSDDYDGQEDKTTIPKFSKADWPIRTLIDYYDDGELNLEPEYQRKFVWEPKRSSRLVITALEQRKIPAVSLHERQDGTYDVIDGKQRLISLIVYFKGKDFATLNWPSAPFTIVNEDAEYSQYHKKTFRELPEVKQRRFRNYNIQVDIYSKDNHPESIFRVYEDLNCGGIDLSDQQIRRCVFHGPYIRLLDELVAERKFMKLVGTHDDEIVKKKRDQDEADRELVLRFFSMYHGDHKYKRSLKLFLNKEMEQRRNMDEKQQRELRKLFTDVLEIADVLFADQAFREIPRGGKKSRSSQISLLLWDTVAVVLADIITSSNRGKSMLKEKAARVRELHLEALSHHRWQELKSKPMSARTLDARRRVYKELVIDPSLGDRLDISC